jgi:DNA-binding GntR family transcriptional regulator
MTDDQRSLRDIELPQIAPTNRQTAHEFVRETLRQAILNGHLAGGTRLVQAELAELLDVSTTPVREALRDLVADGLVRFDPHRGGVVSEIKFEEMEEVYDLRMLLEVKAMELAAENMTPEVLDRARSIHVQMRSAPHSAEWVMMNRDFHMTIYEAADSPKLLAILRGLIDSSVMYVGAAWQVHPNLREQGGADHEEILRRLAAGDSAGAVEAIERHMTIPRTVLSLRS